MLLGPKSKKLKKSFIRRPTLFDQTVKPSLTFGSVGLVALQPGRINARQIEATRKVLRRLLRKEAKTWITIFPQMPLTKKPQEVRMGKGKGNIKYWVCLVKKGQVLYESQGISPYSINKAFFFAKKKLSLKSKICVNSMLC